MLLQHLGADVDLCRALRDCGMFPEETIDLAIRERIRNDVSGGGYVLEAEEL